MQRGDRFCGPLHVSSLDGPTTTLASTISRLKPELTKGAMYFHFRSKHALAVVIIERQTAAAAVAVEDLLSRILRAWKTLIDFSCLVAVEDVQTDGVRAGLNLFRRMDSSPRCGRRESNRRG